VAYFKVAASISVIKWADCGNDENITQKKIADLKTTMRHSAAGGFI
jgi:hypothetical protein